MATLTTLLTTVFALLKISGVINWSWWLVLLPSIIHITIFLIVAAYCAADLNRMDKEQDWRKK